MNFLLSYITFLPTLTKYLRGVTLFHNRQYKAATKAFEKCLKHPRFNNELLFSYYGQSLLAVGKLEDASQYLKKASQLFESEGWSFKDEQTYNLANNTIAALKHIDQNTHLEIERSVLNVKLILKEK